MIIACVGNSLRRDDFIGVKIIRELQEGVSSSVYLIECETIPENFIEPIVRFSPSHVLIIDAALINLEPSKILLLIAWLDCFEVSYVCVSSLFFRIPIYICLNMY